MSTTNRQILLVLLLMLGLLDGEQIAAQGCPIADPISQIKPFFALQAVTQSNNVTLYASDAVRNSPHFTQSKIAMAVNRINSKCASSGDRVPKFTLKWNGPRPPVTPGDTSSENYRSTMLIDFIEGNAPSIDGIAHAARWNPSSNTIFLYSRCPIDGTYNFPCTTDGGPIQWSTLTSQPYCSRSSNTSSSTPWD